ncbi:MAG TPA: hypothetical protein VED19_00830 [Candidatus Nitrosopolaris sp.]|nr:hypothetical protein [Candidatus Nitrosopolaris sp.]
MPETKFIKQLRRRLVELGCPLKRMRRLVREVAEHREDLKQAAMTEGRSQAEAEARADAQLGNPLVLAEQTMVALRQSSWWGRHPVIGFCVVPILMAPVLWLLLFCLELSLGFALGYGWDLRKLPGPDNLAAVRHLTITVVCAHCVAVALVTLFFCWFARQAAAAFKWTVTACVICSLYASFSKGTITPRSFQIAFSWSPDLVAGAVPLLIAGAIYFLLRRTARHFLEKVAE